MFDFGVLLGLFGLYVVVILWHELGHFLSGLWPVDRRPVFVLDRRGVSVRIVDAGMSRREHDVFVLNGVVLGLLVLFACFVLWFDRFSGFAWASLLVAYLCGCYYDFYWLWTGRQHPSLVRE